MAPQSRADGRIGVMIAAVAVLACCLGPTLLAAGVLGAIGTALGNPCVLAGAVLLAGAGLAGWRRRASRRRACPPGPERGNCSRR